MLKHLKAEGPTLYEKLDRNAARLVDGLNAFFADRGAPMHMVHFGSLLRLVFDTELPYGNLLFFHLREKGIDIWERRNLFLSTAHSDQDLEAIQRLRAERLAMQTRILCQDKKRADRLGVAA